MPTYEYYCDKCNKVLEASYSIMVDSSTHPCSVCTAICAKIPSTPNFAVKGANAANGYTTGSNHTGHGSEVNTVGKKR